LRRRGKKIGHAASCRCPFAVHRGGPRARDGRQASIVRIRGGSRGAGQAWSERTPNTGYVRSIWAADHDHAYGIGDGEVHRLVGSSWDLVVNPGLEYPRGITGLDADHIVVIEASTSALREIVASKPGVMEKPRTTIAAIRGSEKRGRKKESPAAPLTSS